MLQENIQYFSHGERFHIIIIYYLAISGLCLFIKLVIVEGFQISRCAKFAPDSTQRSLLVICERPDVVMRLELALAECKRSALFPVLPLWSKLICLPKLI